MNMSTPTRRALLKAFVILCCPAVHVRAAPARPVIFWLYGSAEEGIAQCPLLGPDFFVDSLDLPCHGHDVFPGEAHELSGWRERMQKGETLFGNFNAACRSRLDQLIDIGVADPNRVFVGGVSRGGYAALQLAAQDHRYRAIAALAPVTDLGALSEFTGYTGDAMPLTRYASALADRSLFVCIESQDDRVSTRSTLRFIDAIAAQHRKTDLSFVIESGTEHDVSPQAKRDARNWIISHSR